MDEQYIADHYEDVVIKRDINYANVKRGLDITHKFIIHNKLILIGGMGIDIALKAANHKGIYPPDKLPDYDFLSPDSVTHSSELGACLCKNGLPNISIINAMHTTTRRVRVEFVQVADIGYCPKNIYDTLPYIEYEGMRVIHPHFQMMDIHRAMSLPFERPWAPVIFHRWKKDCIRYDLMADAYPVKYNGEELIKLINVKIDSKLLNGSCLAGWAAFSYWKTKNMDVVAIPVGEPIHILTDDYSKFVTMGTPIKYTEGRMGNIVRSMSIVINNQKYEIFDNLGDQVSAEKIDKMYVVNIQHVMQFLLAKIYLYLDSSVHLKSLCKKLYVECANMIKNSDEPGIIPSINVFGKFNWHESYIINRHEFAAKLNNIKLSRPDRPKNMYPAQPKCATDVDFDYKKSHYFAISGNVIDPFIPKTIEFFGETDIVTGHHNAKNKN